MHKKAQRNYQNIMLAENTTMSENLKILNEFSISAKQRMLSNAEVKPKENVPLKKHPRSSYTWSELDGILSKDHVVIVVVCFSLVVVLSLRFENVSRRKCQTSTENIIGSHFKVN